MVIKAVCVEMLEGLGGDEGSLWKCWRG